MRSKYKVNFYFTMLLINGEANWDFMLEINGSNNIEKYFMLINLDLFFDENFFFLKV